MLGVIRPPDSSHGRGEPDTSRWRLTIGEHSLDVLSQRKERMAFRNVQNYYLGSNDFNPSQVES